LVYDEEYQSFYKNAIDNTRDAMQKPVGM